MSLRTRLTSLAQAIGLDIKGLQTQIDGLSVPYVTYNPWQRFNIAENTTTINATYSVGKVNVFKNGKLLRPNGEDYTATDGTSITFVVTLVATDEIDVETITISDTPANESIVIDRKTYVTGLDGTSTFAVNYTAPYVRVVVNGFVLPPTDYTATSGTNIVLNSPLTVDDVSVDLEGFTAFEFADAYTKTEADALYIPQDLTAVTSRPTLDGTEVVPVLFSGLKKVTVAAIVTWFLSVTRQFAGNLGVGVAPLTTLHIRATNAGTPESTGTGVTGVSARIQNLSVAVDIGTYSNGTSFIQPRLATNNASTFDLVLNPTGGTTKFGKTTAFLEEFDNGNSVPNVNINFGLGQKQRITLTGSHTVIFIFPGVGNYQLKLIQNATGGYTPSWSGVSRYVGSVTAPAINTAANTETIVSIYYDGTNIYLGASKVNG